MKKKQRKSNHLRLVLRYFLLAVLGIAIGLNIYWLNAARLTGNQVPMPFGYGASVVLSGSMEPAISVGDLILVREEEEYFKGDIVVYQSGTISVVHRVVFIDGQTVITRGDANNGDDEPLPVEAVKGKVFGIVPGVGYIVWILKTPAGIIVTMAAALLLVELSFHGEKKKKDDEKERIKAEIRKLSAELRQHMEQNALQKEEKKPEDEGGTDGENK